MAYETPSNNHSTDKEEWERKWERDFNLFKLEYEQATQRYENIYRAIWQIFQYMAFLSAGILTFSSKSDIFPIPVIILIALIPLVFWFLATYIPMDKYGRDLGKHLGQMENKINENFPSHWQLNHYKFFDSRKQENPNILWWPARRIIKFFGIILLILCIIFLSLTIKHYFFKSSIIRNQNKIELELQPVEVTLPNTQLEELKNTLDILSKKIDSIDLIIKEIQANNETRQQSTQINK